MAKDKICKPFLAISTDKFTVDTIDDLKSRNYLTIGDIVDLNGYYTAGDGAHHKRKIESADDGSGVQLANGLWANIVHNGEVNVSWFGAKGDGVTDDTVAIQRGLRAFDFIRLKFDINKNFRITDTIIVPNGAVIFSDKKWFWQGLATDTTLGPERLKMPDGATMYLDIEETKVGFVCDNNVVFNGIDFTYPNQRYDHSDFNKLIKYTWCITAKNNFSLQNSKVIGAHNFLKSSGEHTFVQYIYGYATGTFVKLLESSELQKIYNIHLNPNVVRPITDWNKMVSQNCNVIGVEADEFDGIEITNWFSIFNHTVFKFTGERRLCNFHLQDIFVDFSGILLKNNCHPTLNCTMNNIHFMGGYGKENVDKSRFILCEKTSSKFNSNITITNSSCFYGSSGAYLPNDPKLIDNEAVIENTNFKWAFYYTVTGVVTYGYVQFSKNVLTMQEEFYKGSTKYVVKDYSKKENFIEDMFNEISGVTSSVDGNDFTGAYYTKSNIGGATSQSDYLILSGNKVKNLVEKPAYAGITFTRKFDKPTLDYPVALVFTAREIGDSKGCWVTATKYGSNSLVFDKQVLWEKITEGLYVAKVNVDVRNVSYINAVFNLGTAQNEMILNNIKMIKFENVGFVEPYNVAKEEGIYDIVDFFGEIASN